MNVPQTPHTRTRRSRAQWQHLIGQQQAGDLSVTAFCHQHQLSLTSFYKWKARLSTAIAPSPQNTTEPWIELAMPAPLSQPSQPSQASEWDIELELGQGMVLRLRHP